MATKVLELGELKVTVEAPEELIDELRTLITISSADALMDERAIKMIGGLTACDKIDPSGRGIWAGSMLKGELSFVLFPGGAQQQVENPYMAELAREQAEGRD
jgi:hypothetical protein